MQKTERIFPKFQYIIIYIHCRIKFEDTRSENEWKNGNEKKRKETERIHLNDLFNLNTVNSLLHIQNQPNGNRENEIKKKRTLFLRNEISLYVY